MSHENMGRFNIFNVAPSKIQTKFALNLIIILPLFLFNCWAQDSPIDTAQKVEPTTHVVFKLPEQPIVIVNGLANFDAVKIGSSNMLYPAPNLIGFLAAMATHAVLTKSSRNSREDLINKKADEILEPYRAELVQFKYQELFTQSLSKIQFVSEMSVENFNQTAAKQDILITSLPSYLMTQDQKAVILVNQISIKLASTNKLYENTIRIISPPKTAEKLGEYWFNDHANNFKEEAESLYAKSIDVALEDMKSSAPKDIAFKSLHFWEGGSERIERAQELSTSCTQSLIRTLRGNLMVVPLKIKENTPQAENCASGSVTPN